MPPRRRADTAVDVEGPAYDGVPTVVVHIDAESDSAPAVVEPELPVAVIDVDEPAAESEGESA